MLQNINSILKEKARTSVFVAHRLRTIYDSDQIIVLQGGQVAESGTHSELLSSGGLYAELWNGTDRSLLLILKGLLTVAQLRKQCSRVETNRLPRRAKSAPERRRMLFEDGFATS